MPWFYHMIQYSQRISVVYISIIRVKILELISAINVQVPNLNTTTKNLSIYSTCISSSLRHITTVPGIVSPSELASPFEPTSPSLTHIPPLTWSAHDSGMSLWQDIMSNSFMLLDPKSVLLSSIYINTCKIHSFLSAKDKPKIQFVDHVVTMNEYINCYRCSDKVAWTAYFRESPQYLIIACSPKMSKQIGHWAAVSLIYNLFKIQPQLQAVVYTPPPIPVIPIRLTGIWSE